ncbi:MAG: helix-turn-helix domain-containing protein [Candidatus Thiodiazotropha endolucinida]
MSPLDRLRWLAEITTCNTFKGGSVIRTAVVLANYCNNVTGIAYPSIPTIAKEAGITHESVRSALSSLETMKFLAINRSTGGAPSNTNKFRLILKEGVKHSSGVKRSSGVNSAPGVKHSLSPPPTRVQCTPLLQFTRTGY